MVGAEEPFNPGEIFDESVVPILSSGCIDGCPIWEAPGSMQVIKLLRDWLRLLNEHENGLFYTEKC